MPSNPEIIIISRILLKVKTLQIKLFKTKIENSKSNKKI